MLTTKDILRIEQSANIRVMSAETVSDLNKIDKDIEHCLDQIEAGLITANEAVELIKQA